MSEPEILSRLDQGRREFLALVEGLRPDLHRYCARMTGSVADGEDVVQDALARAFYELSQLRELPALRPWLFRIAHNRALDLLRRREVRAAEPLEAAEEVPAAESFDPDAALAREQAVRSAVSRFLELPPTQRSCVIMKDVLGHSLEEIGALLDLSVPAVKAALSRGRARLKSLGDAPEEAAPRRPFSPAAARYAALFNARDWDGVRSMLADDVRLDLVSRTKRSGRLVGEYFTNYGKLQDCRLVPGWIEGREVLGVFVAGNARLDYFIELVLSAERVSLIRDYRHCPYVARDARFTAAGSR